MNKNIAVFASGTGSNFQSIIDAIENNNLDANIKLLVCDNKDAIAIKRAKDNNIPVFIFDPTNYEKREDYESEIINELNSNDVNLIVLAGFMRILTPHFINQFEQRIINIHPSLLPAFPGMDAIGQAIKHGVKVMGVTIHFVDTGVDTGQIIAQEAFSLTGIETNNQIINQVHAIEHRLYPVIIGKVLKGENL